MGDMAVQPAYIVHRIDVEEYHRMAEAGVFDPDARIELIDGELIERVGPIHPPHASVVTRIANSFVRLFGECALVRNQQPVTLGSHSEPQPDIALVSLPDDLYEKRHPHLAELFVLIEVADSTRTLDQRKKVPMYARAGVPEVWLVDLVDACVHVYRQPADGRYAEHIRHGRGEQIAVAAFPTNTIEVASLLPLR